MLFTSWGDSSSLKKGKSVRQINEQDIGKMGHKSFLAALKRFENSFRIAQCTITKLSLVATIWVASHKAEGVTQAELICRPELLEQRVVLQQLITQLSSGKEEGGRLLEYLIIMLHCDGPWETAGN